jgi:beta-lactamase superfamily II metal-dependent hydrolase
MVLPRHGTDAKSTDDFVSAVSPRLAVVSVGENAFGLPSPSTELLLADLPELRTDRNGRVRLRFEPNGLAVDFDHGSPRQVATAPK